MTGYFTISDACNFEMKIKRSHFIANMRHVNTIAEAKSFISDISAEHMSANHNCWAYIIGDNGDIEHSSDQGEPPGSAGKPMLNELLKHRLTNIAAVVSRYFGGTKLGIPGLIEAYSSVIEMAIATVEVTKLVNLVPFMIETIYTQHDFIRHQLTELGALSIESSFTEIIHVSFSIPENQITALELFCEEMRKTGRINRWAKTKTDSI